MFLNFDINLWATLLAGVLIFLIGGLWYSPLLFGEKWMHSMGLTINDINESGKSHTTALLASIVSSLVMTGILSIVIVNLNITSTLHGVVVSLMLYIGLNFTTIFKLIFWEDRPIQLTAIDSAYDLLSFVIAGGVLAYWR